MNLPCYATYASSIDSTARRRRCCHKTFRIPRCSGRNVLLPRGETFVLNLAMPSSYLHVSTETTAVFLARIMARCCSSASFLFFETIERDAHRMLQPFRRSQNIDLPVTTDRDAHCVSPSLENAMVNPVMQQEAAPRDHRRGRQAHR